MVEKKGFMMSKVVHCCELMDILVNDCKMPLQYDPVFRMYGINLNHSNESQIIGYCGWCGKELPDNLYEVYFNTLEKEYGIKPVFDILNDPNVPKEFKGDEWWKKRGL